MCRVEIVRMYVVFSYNNPQKDSANANRFMNFINLSGFAPCQGKNETVLLTQIGPIAYGALLDASVTDTLPIPGVGHYRAMHHMVIIDYRHLGEIKGNFIFFVNLEASYSPSFF